MEPILFRVTTRMYLELPGVIHVADIKLSGCGLQLFGHLVLRNIPTIGTSGRPLTSQSFPFLRHKQPWRGSCARNHSRQFRFVKLEVDE